MWRHTAFAAAAGFALAAPLAGQPTTTDLSGKWTLDRDSSVIGGRGNPATELTITQDPNTLTVTRSTTAGVQAIVYKLDGSESTNPTGRSGQAIYRSRWDGGKLVTTITTQGPRGQATQTETLSIVAGALRNDTSRPDPQGGAPFVAKLVYRRG